MSCQDTVCKTGYFIGWMCTLMCTLMISARAFSDVRILPVYACCYVYLIARHDIINNSLSAVDSKGKTCRTGYFYLIDVYFDDRVVSLSSNSM